MRQLETMIETVPSVEWVILNFAILRSKKELSTSDINTLQYVDVLLQKLNHGEKIVVHCHAGLHRSGLFVYILLRRRGLSEAASIEALRTTRQRTFDEMMYKYKKGGTLVQEAERLFQSFSFDFPSSG